MTLKHRFRREDGQSMVEFAVLLPILLVILCGIVDFGWLFYNRIALTNSAREGARYAVVHYNASAAWEQDVKDEMLDGLVGVDDPTITVRTMPGDKIKVTVTASPRILTAFTSTILGKNTMEMTGECTMKIEH